jgi:hypothetical protein
MLAILSVRSMVYILRKSRHENNQFLNTLFKLRNGSNRPGRLCSIGHLNQPHTLHMF